MQRLLPVVLPIGESPEIPRVLSRCQSLFGWSSRGVREEVRGPYHELANHCIQKVGFSRPRQSANWTDE